MPAIIVDPGLIARVTRQFQLRGQLQPFNLTENVIPVFDIGKLTGVDVTKVATPDSETAVRVGTSAAHLTVGEPAHDAADVFQTSASSPTGGTILSDTGQLTAGIHRIEVWTGQDSGSQEHLQLEWRNAANNATLATWNLLSVGQFHFGPIYTDMATNERFRLQQIGNSAASVFTTITALLTSPSVA